MIIGPGQYYDIDQPSAPGLYPPTTYLSGQVATEAREAHAALLPRRLDAVASWHAWAQIVSWAELYQLPISYFAATSHSGPKLACLDPDTQETVLAWARWRVDTANEPVSWVSIDRSDGDGNWDEDPGTGEHLTHSPAVRLHQLAAFVAEGLALSHPGVRVGIKAYGATARDLPGTVHPGVAWVVCGPAFLPPGLSVEDVTAELVAAGAEVVQPYAYWCDWYKGEGLCLLMQPDKVAEVLAWPRHGTPDALHGAVQSWVALRPSLYALSRLLGMDSDTIDVRPEFERARQEYLDRVFPTSEHADAWYGVLHEGRQTTPDLLNRLYQHCANALYWAEGDELQRVVDLVLHTRYLDLRLSGTHEERIAFVWSIAHRHVVQVRVACRDLGIPQGGPPDGTVLEPGVDDPLWCTTLCSERIAALPLLPWEPETYPLPALWPGDGPVLRRGVLGSYWRPHLDRAGRWYARTDAAGLVSLELAGGIGDTTPDTQVGVYDLDGGLQHTWSVTGDGVAWAYDWLGEPLTTYEIRSLDGAHGEGLRVRLPSAGLQLCYAPDPGASVQATIGTTRAYIRIREGAPQLGLYATGTVRVWAPGVAPNPGWSTGWVYESTEAGHHTIAVPPEWSGQWVAVTGALVIPLHGAAPYLCSRPDEGPEVAL